MHKILEFNDEFTLEEICDSFNLTKRGVELKFLKGATPKFFLQKIRFHNFLKRALESQQLDLTRLALNAGYYDQSHLIRTSRKFIGLPHSRLIHLLSNSNGLNKKLNFSIW